MTEHCCEMLQQAVDGDAIVNQPLLQMRGRLLNELDSDYAVRSPEDRPNLFPINFCPFCRKGSFKNDLERGKKEMSKRLMNLAELL